MEWRRPGLGYAALIWGPTLLGSRGSHGWRGTWAEAVEAAGLRLETDVDLDSLNRCQVFRKPGDR